MIIENRTTHSCIQGSDEWHALRAGYFTASEAPAMLGVSKYQTRAGLLKCKATGIAEEFDAATQRRFDNGHAAEAVARPIVEGIVGEELYPVTITADVDGLPLLASMDGLTLLGDIGWETKLLNKDLRAAVEAGTLEEHYTVQMEQQLMVSGASRIYFTTTDGTPEGTFGMWYESNPELRARIVAGWKQFVEDLKSYTPEPVQAAPAAKPVEGFGTLTLRVEGRVLASNLDTFKAGAEAFLARLPNPHELQTDQDFADAESAAKACAEAEDRIKAAKEQAIAQMADVDTVLRTADEVAAAIRAARLALDKAVKAEKEARKLQIVTQAHQALVEHIQQLNQRIAPASITPAGQQLFGEAIKGLKSLDSMRDKVSTVLANAKIDANALADLIEANRRTVDDMTLVPDFAQVCTKSAEDFQALLALRKQQRAEAEAKRLEAERARIRAEEEAKLRREAEQAAQAERAQWAQLEAHEAEQLRQQQTGQPLRVPDHAEDAPGAAEPVLVTDNGNTVTLGQINAHIAPIKLDAAGLSQLGFEQVAQKQGAKHYRSSDLPRICAAIITHIQRVQRADLKAA